MISLTGLLLNEPDRDNLTAASTYDGVAGKNLKDGVLVDVVYNFTAGDSKPKTESDGKVTRDLTGRNAVISADEEIHPWLIPSK